jgi:phenylalanyl-tRNA synthetase beta chain
MPTAELDKKLVLWYLQKPLTDEALKDGLTAIGVNPELVTKEQLVVEIMPNRPDLLGEEGIARALRGFLGIKPGLMEYTVKKGDYVAKIDPAVKGVREHAVCAVVKGVHIDEPALKALMQLQEKLHTTHARKRKAAAVGLHDLDKIKFPIKYTAVKGDFKFRPLESEHKMAINEILKLHPKGKEYAHLLPGDRYPIWIDSKETVLAMPPIVNAADTAVTTKTNNLFIDVTGLDKKVVDQTLNMVVTVLADRGGQIFSVKVGKETTPDLKPSSMKLSADYVNKMLGLTLSRKEIAGCLERMRFGVKIGDKALTVLVPKYRTDVLHPIDLVEDVAIGHGYDNFEPHIPNVSTVGEESREAVFVRKAAEIMAGLGFLECATYHLSSRDVLLKKMGLPVDKELIEVPESVNMNYDTLRDSLLPGLMQILSENKHHEYPQMLFDIGRVILPDRKAANRCQERLHLSSVISHSSAGFTWMKSLVEAFFRATGDECSLEPAEHPSYTKGRAASIVINKRKAGIIGEISPVIINNFKLENAVVAFEVEF